MDLFSLWSTDEEGFVASPEWRGEMTKRDLRCGHCHALRRDTFDQIDQVVICGNPRRLSFGLASACWGGLIIRANLVKLIGEQRLMSTCSSVPVSLENGKVVDDLRFYVERRPHACRRGGAESQIGLCMQCDRLLYWPQPAGYLLKHYWGDERVRVLDYQVICTADFVASLASDRAFRTLKADIVPVKEEPEDGLPAQYNDMVSEIRRRGLKR
jgi:hypothetical protein